jgi:hypothetical protein
MALLAIYFSLVRGVIAVINVDHGASIVSATFSDMLHRCAEVGSAGACQEWLPDLVWHA